MLHHLRVDLRYAVANGVVQLDQGEEAPVTQLAEQEARDDADGGLDLGLVAWASNARRQHDEAVVIGEILIKATLPNPDGALWPGQFVNVQLLVRVDRGVATVPSTAIQRGPDGTWVYLVKADQTVAVQPVRVRRFGGGIAVLEEGVSPVTTVVSAGHYRLTPGAHITIVQATAATPPA